MTWKYLNVISTLLLHEFGIFYKIVGFFGLQRPLKGLLSGPF